MDISELDFDLPADRIAQTPSDKRDASRLMVVDRAAGTVSHFSFFDLPSLLHRGDGLVLNDTKVRACRLYAKRAKSGGRVEIFLLNQTGEGAFRALARAGGKLEAGEELIIEQGAVRVCLQSREADGEWAITAVDAMDKPLNFDALEVLGRMPLPPYIQRSKDGLDPFDTQDRLRYQTVYAKQLGAVAAPTAGLHFTPELLDTLQQKGVHHTSLTLHVGVGTFRPLSVDRVEDHPMHAELFEVSSESAAFVNQVRASQARVVAVGSTSTRTLESIADESGRVYAGQGATDLLIVPGYRFKSVDAMITNFHLPRSTLLALVMAFAGQELMREAYAIAVQDNYRFFSYGDAMLIL